MKTVLFQGDSITDAGRVRSFPDQSPPVNHVHALGMGYAGRAAGRLLACHPEQDLRIFNRGIAGDRVWSLRDRYETGFAMIQPDILSILVGVNDTWHGAAKGLSNGTDLEDYDRIYRELLDRVKADFPSVKLVICEPFTTEAGAVLQLAFHPDIDERRRLVRAIADDYADVWVPFQEMFDGLLKQAPAAYWAPDGVHPSPAGHERMAEFWVKRTEELF